MSAPCNLYSIVPYNTVVVHETPIVEQYNIVQQYLSGPSDKEYATFNIDIRLVILPLVDSVEYIGGIGVEV